MKPAPGWVRESAELYVHDSGARLSKTTYRGKVAWWFFPVSLDIQAVEYPPTDAGCDEAFRTSGMNLPKSKPARNSRSLKRGEKAVDSDKGSAEQSEGSSDGSDPDDEEGEEDTE